MPGVDKSSGAPICRGASAGGGGSLAAVLVPSARGAPGAFGLAPGSKASPRLGGGLSIGADDTCEDVTDEPAGDDE